MFGQPDTAEAERLGGAGLFQELAIRAASSAGDGESESVSQPNFIERAA